MSHFRRYGRRVVRYPVKLNHTQQGEFLGYTSNISDMGMFILGNDLSPHMMIGDTLMACLYSSEDAVESMSLRVVRKTVEGVGFSFV